MNRAISVACAVLLVGLWPLTAGGEEGVKLLVGFEWEEYAPKASRSVIIGKPIEGAAKPGFRAEPYTKLEEVGPDGFQVFSRRSSRDHAGARMVRKHATQGQFAWKCNWTAGRWAWRLGEIRKKWPGAWPPHESTYDVIDHFYQRESQLHKQTWRETTDWSGYQRLRFDVTSLGAPLKLGVRVRDGTGPVINPGPTGIRTALVTFTVPADETVTCDFPLAEIARVSELDLKRIHRYNIRLNGFPAGKAPADLYFDNIRLVAKGAETDPKHKLIPMDGEMRPFARRVSVRPPTRCITEKLKREVGPVAPLGPVVINKGALYAGRLGHGSGHFGASGATYFSTSRRAVVAYDNKRLLVVIGGRDKPRGAKGARGGTIAIASFDGGTTWGGLAGKDKDFTELPWYLRSNFSADQFGNVFAVGTPNCDSYNEGQDICLHRLAFTGETWVDDRFAVLHQDGYKCPHNCNALTLANGRIWAAWGDGFGGYFARYSDDDGFTFAPCKDASLAPPRPFYQPKLEDLGKPDAPPPPKEILLWPTPAVPTCRLTPFGDHVAVVGGKAWAAFDGKKWGPTQKVPPALGKGLLTVTTLGQDHLFISRGAPYHNLGKEMLSDLVVADCRGGKWRFQQLEKENVSSAIVTASGDAVYCLYVVKISDEAYEVRYRRHAAGKWGEPVKVATEARRINHLAAPQISPPGYAAVFWDQHFRRRGDASEVKFVRVPNK